MPALPGLWRWASKLPPSISSFPRLLALGLLATYTFVAVISYVSTSRPHSLGIEIGRCADAPCIIAVSPGSLGWVYGARPGMDVVSINGQPVDSTAVGGAAEGPVTRVRLTDRSGNSLDIALTLDTFSQSPMKYSIWTLGALFALLGAAVIFRRPDFNSARALGLFCGLVSLSLAVSPSAGLGVAWARISLIISMLWMGAPFLSLVMALTTEQQGRRLRRITLTYLVLAGVITLLYLASLFVLPVLARMSRSAILLYFSASLLGSVTILAIQGLRQGSPVVRQQVRIVVWGIAFGILPFVLFTVIPQALDYAPLLPEHITILAVGLVPVAFTYSIFQHQLLGIRRLVHRGMVYGIATFGLLFLMFGLLALLAVWRGGNISASPTVAASLLVLSTVLFLSLRQFARWLVDNLIFGKVLDYETALHALQQDAPSPEKPSHVGEGLVNRVAQMLDLESAILFVRAEEASLELSASAGPRAREILRQHAQLGQQLTETAYQATTEIRWQSESLLAVPLSLSGRNLGYMLLGPKRGGEPFLSDETSLVNTLGPVISLALEQSQLSSELSELNQRLIKTEEMERAKIAGDLHDGPLQKAMLLSSSLGLGVNERKDFARQIVLELREICSRLRPAILDDLGVFPALDWLLKGMTKSTGIEASLSVSGIAEDARLDPDVELAMFRVTQEAANNVVKHAKASSITVTATIEADMLLLMVVDNGVGLAKGSARSSGFGIPGMRERIRQIGGTLKIESNPGGGTSVMARIPWAGAVRAGESI